MVFTTVAYVPVIGEGDGEGELSQPGVEKSLYRILTSGSSFVFTWYVVFTTVAYFPVIGEGDGEGELCQSGVENRCTV